MYRMTHKSKNEPKIYLTKEAVEHLYNVIETKLNDCGIPCEECICNFFNGECTEIASELLNKYNTKYIKDEGDN